MLAHLAKERDESNQPVAELKTRITKEIPQIKSKLDRLLDAHLEGLIEKSEYQVKKEALLKAKVELEEKLVKLEQRATGWFEPCEKFLQSAHHAHQVLTDGNFESLIETAKKIGSNYRLARARLHFSYNLPWAHLAGGVTSGNLRPRWFATRTAFQDFYRKNGRN